MTQPRYGIRARITGGSVLIAILFSTVAGVIIWGQIDRIVAEGSVAVLRADAAPYEDAIRAGQALGDPGPGAFIAVVDSTGATLVNSLPRPLSDNIPSLLAGPGATHAVAAGDATFLVREAEVAGAGGRWHVISARDGQSQEQVLRSMTTLLIVAIAGIDIALGAASWALTTVALRPVRRMRAAAEVLAREGGDETLPAGPPEDEIAELARTLNTLILRLRAAADRERQIVSDASHELRTPIAIVRTQLEVARAEASSVEQLTADIARAEVALARLSHLADDLLELSRIDAQPVGGSASVGELATALTDAADRARLRALGRHVAVDYDDSEAVEADLRVALSTTDAGRILDNLVSNALAAIGEDGSIDLRLVAGPTAVELRVSDTGGGMEPSFAAHALKRFTRADDARTGTGAGLGLAIVDGLASAAGGSIELLNRPGDGLTVVVVLPVLGESRLR